MGWNEIRGFPQFVRSFSLIILETPFFGARYWDEEKRAEYCALYKNVAMGSDLLFAFLFVF
jgi:hypothetical protein